MNWRSLSLLALCLALGQACGKKQEPLSDSGAKPVPRLDAQVLSDGYRAPPVVKPFPDVDYQDSGVIADSVHLHLELRQDVGPTDAVPEAGLVTAVGPDLVRTQRSETHKLHKKAEVISQDVKAIGLLLDEKRRTMTPEAYRQWRVERAKAFQQARMPPNLT